MPSKKSMQNLNPFQKGQSGNPKGRPRKSFNSINEQLKKEGFEPLTRASIVEGYELIFNATEEKLKAIMSDKDAPFGLRLIIMELQNKSTRSRALQDMRDYMFGKATENKKVTTEVEQRLFPDMTHSHGK